jgi:hypothetical protein
MSEATLNCDIRRLVERGYRFSRDELGAKGVQFNPIVERAAAGTPPVFGSTWLTASLRCPAEANRMARIDPKAHPSHDSTV